MKDFVVHGPTLNELVGGDDAKVKYVRLFAVPDNPRWIDTLVEFMAAVSNWTERELGELTMAELGELFQDTRTEVENIAVDPTPDEPSETGGTEPNKKSPAGAES